METNCFEAVTLGGLRQAQYPVGTMPIVSLYLSLAALLIAVSATALCFAYFGAFRHHATLWLSACMVGISFFALTGLTFQLSVSQSAGSSLLGPPGLRLLWQALGAVFVVHSLPRFLLSAFAATPRRPVYRLLDAATLIVLLLSAIRVDSGWNAVSSVAVLPNTILRILLYAIIGAALVATLIFQSRLPDRSLYQAVIVQIGALALLFPFVVLEDLRLFRITSLPYLSGQLLLILTSLSVILFARRSLKRPKYVDGRSPSRYFVDHFGVSERELDVVTSLLDGLSNNEIAERLFISPRTVETHLHNIYQKTGIKSRTQLFNLLRSDEL